eukprot:Rmarinus@m.3698
MNSLALDEESDEELPDVVEEPVVTVVSKPETTNETPCKDSKSETAASLENEVKEEPSSPATDSQQPPPESEPQPEPPGSQAPKGEEPKGDASSTSDGSHTRGASKASEARPTMGIKDPLAKLKRKEPTTPRAQVKQEPRQAAEVPAKEGGDNVIDFNIIATATQKMSEKARASVATLMKDRWHVSSWRQLITECQSQPIEHSRKIYDQFFRMFPTAGRVWQSYAEQELEAGNRSRVEAIFHRCLLTCPYLDLWKLYVKYVRDVKGTDKAAEGDIIQAYEFALKHVGQDISATSLWDEYIKFLQARSAENVNEEAAKMTLVRKAFQRAIQVPMYQTQLDALWAQYETFENATSNKQLAQKLLADLRVKYQAARTCLQERKVYRQPINISILSEPPQGTKVDQEKLSHWLELIEFERRNVQRLESAALHDRVTFTFNQALLVLYYYPEIWVEAAAYQISEGHVDTAEDVYKRGCAALPESALLHFAFADFYEKRATATGDKQTQQSFISEASKVYKRLLVKNKSPVVWVQYMLFVRRQEGIKESRAVFLQARAFKSHQVYMAAADLEFSVNKDSEVARRIYELGLNKLPFNVGYVLKYISFLRSQGDLDNARVILEKVLQKEKGKDTHPLWQCFVEMELWQGNLEAAYDIEQRMVASLKEDSPKPLRMFEVLADRYSYGPIRPATPGATLSLRGKQAAQAALAVPAEAKNIPLAALDGTLPEPLAGFVRAIATLPPTGKKASLTEVEDVIQKLADLPIPAFVPESPIKKRALEEESAEDTGQESTVDVYRSRQKSKIQKLF